MKNSNRKIKVTETLCMETKYRDNCWGTLVFIQANFCSNGDDMAFTLVVNH